MHGTLLIWDVLRLAAPAAALLVSACAKTSTIEARVGGEPVGNQGGSWEVVLGSPEAPLHDGWEIARLDEAMNIQGSAIDESRPSLDDLRRVYLNPRPDQVIYFRRPRHR
jgi:hypothetical protein